MEPTLESIWQRLDSLNISKVFILFAAKRTKKNPELQVTIQSIIVTTKCEKNNVDWGEDIYDFDSPMTKPIREECAELDGKMDGMLTYNNDTRQLNLSATLTRKVREKIKKRL